MTLRDEIASAISKECGVDYDFTLQGQYDAADAILATVREALLDSHVVAYAHRKVGSEYVLPAHLTEGIAAALDAVTGEGGER
jgi:hypothetical protein